MTVIINGTSGVTSVNGSAAAPSVTGTDTDTGIVYGTNTLSLATGGTTAVTVDSSQNVGIGTTTPSAQLHVKNGGGNSISILGQYGSGTIAQVGAFANQMDIKAYNGTNDVMTFTTGASERMRVDSSGNLLVGTTSASAKFSLNNGAAGNLAYFTDGVNTDFYIKTTSSIATIGPNAGSTNLAFQTSGTEKARITSAGLVFINRTTDIANGMLQISGIVDSRVAIQTYQNATTTQGAIWFNNPNGKVGSIDTNGSATSYNTSSDYRLKENVQLMTGALEKVAALKPVTYTWKVDGSEGEGFIAHELAEVCPHAVTGEKDAVETYVDDEGNEQTRPVYQGIDVSFLVATLTAAIQEQQAIIEQLRADVETLKGNV